VSDARSSKTWVLDTETKGTGAEMVPLERVLEDPSESGHSVIVVERKRRSEPPAEPRGPRQFRVVDVMTKRVLADRADTRGVVDLLGGVRSVVDVDVYVWEDAAAKWQQLTQREKQMLWGLRSK
jgi:hypothetical protein